MSEVIDIEYSKLEDLGIAPWISCNGNMPYFSLALFNPEELFKHLLLVDDPSDKKYRKTRRVFVVDEVEHSVKICSQRYTLFSRGISCMCCGAKGEYMSLDEWVLDGGCHFNLYSVVDNELILMTKDHIVPKSKGGKNNLDNYQTMCSPCNELKGDVEMTLEELRDHRNELREHVKMMRKRHAMMKGRV